MGAPCLSPGLGRKAGPTIYIISRIINPDEVEQLPLSFQKASKAVKNQ